MAAPSTITPLVDATIIRHEKRTSTVDTLAPSIKQTGDIRIVEPHEYKEAAACLAEAFRHDHVVRYAIDTPDRMHLTEEERFEMHKQAMEYVTYAHCLNGLVITVGDNYACVALWLPPGKNIDDWWTVMRSGMWRMMFKLSKEGKERFFTEFLPLLGNTKSEVLGELNNDSWYLNYIGTKESARGKGYAKKLVEYVTKQADQEGRVCYLESSHDVNLKIYSKMGFTLKKEIFLERDKDKHRMDVMVREPKMRQNEK